MTNDECRECRVGRMQAVNCDIAWFCPDHGTQRLDIGAMLTALAQARATIAERERERNALRDAIVEAHATVMETYTEDEATPLHENLLEFFTSILQHVPAHAGKE